MVGYFDFRGSPQPLGYKSFVVASIKSLAADPWRRLAFGVVSSKSVASKLRFKNPSNFMLFSWNSTSSYDAKSLKSDALLKWSYNEIEKIASLIEWVIPSGLKSNLLSEIIKSKGATLILFTPRSLSFGLSPYYSMVSYPTLSMESGFDEKNSLI